MLLDNEKATSLCVLQFRCLGAIQHRKVAKFLKLPQWKPLSTGWPGANGVNFCCCLGQCPLSPLSTGATVVCASPTFQDGVSSTIFSFPESIWGVLLLLEKPLQPSKSSSSDGRVLWRNWEIRMDTTFFQDAWLMRCKWEARSIKLIDSIIAVHLFIYGWKLAIRLQLNLSLKNFKE